MDDKPLAPRASGIPRLTSRLPVPKTNSLRTSRSRESLGGELRNPRLRATASRDQLASSSLRRSGTWDAAQPQPRQVRSRPNLRADLAARQSVGPVDDHSKRPSQAVPPSPKDEILIKRTPALTRRPSEIFAASPLAHPVQPTPSQYRNPPESQKPSPDATSEGFAFDTPTSRSTKPRPSLSERTIETLSQLPSSPAITKKPSAFFDSEHGSTTRSRASSNASRPGSSYTSDGSNRPGSRPQSRPGSSSGPEEGSMSTFRSSAYKGSLASISGTPSARTPQPRSRKTPGSRSALRQSMPGAASLPRPSSQARSPSPEKHTVGAPSPSPAPRTLAARPLRLKPSSSGLLKKAGESEPRKVSTASTRSSAASQDSVFSSSASTTSTNTTATNDSTGDSGKVCKSRKSSAALREQIAKAKAAKRAAARQSVAAPSEDVEEEEETPVRARAPTAASVQDSVPVEEGVSAAPVEESWGFDITAASDPFNQRRGEMAKSKILQQRANAGRTSGRLNIAAMGLKQIPLEVMKMYDMESVGTYGGNWAECVDLTRFVAADNELETIDDSVFPDKDSAELTEDEEGGGNIFGGLETIDLHGNMLISIPVGLRQLKLLTSLNLSHNRLQNETMNLISQIAPLRDLKLANNLFYGPLPPSFADLENLEILDLHGNNVSALPANLEKLSRLRILNVNDNSFESLPFAKLAKLPLTELLARNNKLSGALVGGSVDSLPSLQSLDVSSNKLTQIVTPGASIAFPCLHQLCLSMNRIQGLPDVSSWVSLLTLTADENSIAAIPEGFTCLPKIRHVDFSSNDIRIIPAEIARMDSLAMLRLSGNPLRDKKFSSITTDELKDALSIRLEPPPPYQERSTQPIVAEVIEEPKIVSLVAKEVTVEAVDVAVDAAVVPERNNGDDDDDSRSDIDDFATPPTSAPHSPVRSRAHTLSNQAGPRSRAATLSNQTWPVKNGGVLDRSHTESSSLHPVVCSKVAAEHKIHEVQLHHNLFTALPESLSFFADTLTALSLAHNQMVGENYLAQVLELPVLRELNLVSNHITSLAPLISHLRAPVLEKLDVSLNRITALPTDLKAAFPKLSVLLASNNHIIDLNPESIKGIKIVEVGNNDIAHLNPRIGLLGGVGGLERLEVMGNRFRVPRWSVLERGTDATLRWLRGRVPVAEMAAWKEANRDGTHGSDDLSDVD